MGRWQPGQQRERTQGASVCVRTLTRTADTGRCIACQGPPLLVRTTKQRS